MTETSLHAIKAHLQLAILRPTEEQMKIYDELSKLKPIMTETHQFLNKVIDELKGMR